MGVRELDETTTFDHAARVSAQHRITLAPTYGRFIAVGLLGSGGMGVVISAYDPKLDRKVALKLLRPELYQRDAGARLLREAQAMARLAHPNVVNVFEVGEAGDQIFVAMELVEGETLKSWLSSAPRGTAEILDVFIAAGRGLEAAHRAGLVHRDFKPENVLIGRDRRARVVDFGLVVAGTANGSTQGTPAYMSPEQRSGGTVDARSDQYSFALALSKALDRGGKSYAPALQRALSEKPEDRWPSMTALLDHLDLKRRGHRRAWIAAGAAVALLASAIVFGTSRAVCEPPEARVASLWSPQKQEAIRTRFVSVDPENGAQRATAAAQMLDRVTRAWSEMHVEACRASRIEHRELDALFDLRMRCLGRRFDEVQATVALIERVDGPKAIDGAVSAAAKLPPIDVCADLDALSSAAPPPESPQGRSEASAIEVELAKLELDYRAGNIEAMLPRTKAIVERAKTLGHAPVTARALHLLAQAQISASVPLEAVETLEKLAETAAKAKDDERVAFALIKIAHIKGWDLGKPEQALALLPAAQATTLRAGSPFLLEIDRLISEGVVFSSNRRFPEMTERISKAKSMLEERGATEDGSPYLARLSWVEMQYGVMLLHDPSHPGVAHLDRALELNERAYGAGHPESVSVLTNRGEALRRAGKYKEAAESYQRAATIVETRIGETPLLTRVLVQLGTALSEAREFDRALPLLARALELSKKVLREDDPRLVGNMLGYASLLESMKRDEEAKQMFDEIISLADRHSIKNHNIAFTYFNRAEILARRDACSEAIVDYRRAITLLEETLGTESVYLLYLQRGLGHCLVRLRRHEEAIPVLERALAAPQGRGKEQRAAAQYWLGRALYESGRDRSSGLARVKTARAQMVEIGDASKDDLAELDRWHQPRGLGMR